MRFLRAQDAARVLRFNLGMQVRSLRARERTGFGMVLCVSSLLPACSRVPSGQRASNYS